MSPTNANPRDGAEVELLLARTAELERENQELREQVLHWRRQVVQHWSRLAGVEAPHVQVSDAAQQLEAIQRTLSWRVTAPLRIVRRRMGRPG